jgi:hypothetical protein
VDGKKPAHGRQWADKKKPAQGRLLSYLFNEPLLATNPSSVVKSTESSILENSHFC